MSDQPSTPPVHEDSIKRAIALMDAEYTSTRRSYGPAGRRIRSMRLGALERSRGRGHNLNRQASRQQAGE